MSNKIFAFFPFMGLSFHWQNPVLLTQRTSISKLLKPNFLYQAPETGTNFHRIIHFFPLKKKKEKRMTFECLLKGQPGMGRGCRVPPVSFPVSPVFTPDSCCLLITHGARSQPDSQGWGHCLRPGGQGLAGQPSSSSHRTVKLPASSSSSSSSQPLGFALSQDLGAGL